MGREGIGGSSRRGDGGILSMRPVTRDRQRSADQRNESDCECHAMRTARSVLRMARRRWTASDEMVSRVAAHDFTPDLRGETGGSRADGSAIALVCRTGTDWRGSAA